MFTSAWSPMRTSTLAHTSSGWEDTLNVSTGDRSKREKGKKIVKGLQIYNFYVCCRCLLSENRWNSVSVSYLDLYNHSGWGWRTWWGTYSLAASVRAPAERRVLKAAKWKRWDRSQGEWAYSLFSNGHSLPSGSPQLTKIQAGGKMLNSHTNVFAQMLMEAKQTCMLFMASRSCSSWCAELKASSRMSVSSLSFSQSSERSSVTAVSSLSPSSVVSMILEGRGCSLQHQTTIKCDKTY